MPIQTLNPYILLNGKAAAAIAFYEKVLGAKTERRMSYGEGPCAQVEPQHRDQVMHATLRVGEALLMVSDVMPGQSGPESGTISIVLHFSNKDELIKAFNGLAEGGKVNMPLQDTFWGAHFGMLTDPFKVDWMLSYELPKQ